MRIITMYISESVLKQIDALCGPNRLYPSRSEFFRAALKSFLTHYFATHSQPSTQPEIDLTTVRVKCDEISTSHPGRHMLDISKINALIENKTL